MENVQDHFVFNKIFGLFQTYQKTGQCSRLVLETMGGALFANLSVQCPTRPTSPGWNSSSAKTKRSRRITPSRMRRNKARHEKWLARKISENQDSLEKKKDDVEDIPDKEKNPEEPIFAEPSKNDISTENPRQLVCLLKKAAENLDGKEEVIEQIDGNIESTVAYDLTISAVNLFDAFCSIEENLCSAEDSPKIPFISEIPSKEEVDINNAENTLFTLEVKFDNEKKFLARVEETFRNWDP